MQQVFHQFLENLKATTPFEYIAVIAGILSVWFSKKENILVYPVGLINTIIYVYLSFKFDLIGEASVNFYYTVVSIYGWYAWARKDKQFKQVLQISFSKSVQIRNSILFFVFLYLAIFITLTYLKQAFYPGVIPWADAFASATAFTGMWLMARKKVESWYWWIATNLTSIPLYFVKGLVFTSVYYCILLVLAFWGLKEWKLKAGKNNQSHKVQYEVS